MVFLLYTGIYYLHVQYIHAQTVDKCISFCNLKKKNFELVPIMRGIMHHQVDKKARHSMGTFIVSWFERKPCKGIVSHQNHSIRHRNDTQVT